jgi:hypothetical protein
VFAHSAIVGLLTGCLSSWLSIGRPLDAALWTSTITGAAIGALYVLGGWGSSRGIVALVIAAATAVAAREFFALPLGPVAAIGLTALGLSSALAGAAALLRYVKRHPAARGEEQ